MKTHYLIFLFLSVCNIAPGQSTPDILIDRTHKMFEFEANLYYLDTVGDHYLTVLSEAGIDEPPLPLTKFITKLKIISKQGMALKEKIINNYTSSNNCKRVGDNYLIVINSNYNNRVSGSYIKNFLYDKYLNLLQDTIINLADDTLSLENPQPSATGQYISIGDSTYFIVPMKVRKNNVENSYFSITVYNHDGFYQSAKLIPLDQNFSNFSMRSPFTIPDPLRYIQPNINYFNFFDSTFNLIEIKRPKLPHYTWKTANQAVYSEGFVYLYGPSNFNGVRFFKNIVLKLDTQLNVVDSIIFDQQFSKTIFSSLFDHEVPPGCVYVDEDGNLNAVSYYNGVGRDGGEMDVTPGRIFVSKFSPDMKVICQETYENPHWKINLSKGLYLGNGNLLVTGMMDTIDSKTNINKDYYPFIGLISDGCALTWATRVEELSSKDPLDFPGEILVSPNPASNQLHLEYQGDYPLLLLTKIFNSAGVVTHVVPAWQSNNLTIDLKNYPPGIYFYSVTTKSGKVTTGKFIKS